MSQIPIGWLMKEEGSMSCKSFISSSWIKLDQARVPSTTIGCLPWKKFTLRQ